MKRHLLAVAALLAAASSAHAYDLDIKYLKDVGGTQDEFRMLSEDLSAALSYRAVESSESLGLLGFDLGISLGGTDLKSTSIIAKATNNADVPSTLPIATVRATKGLPGGFNIGASYGVVPGTSANAVGVMGSWSVLSGGMLSPAVALRAHYTKVGGITNLDMSSVGGDISISKGFLMLTPFVGAGVVKTKSKSDLYAHESYSQSRVFADVNVNLLFMDLTFALDKTGDDRTITAKAGFRF